MHSHSYYRNFREEEFASDDYFQHWVLTPDDTADVFWKAFLEVYPLQRETVLGARKLVEQLKGSGQQTDALTAEEKTELKSVIFKALNLPEQKNDEKKIGDPFRKWGLTAAVALIMLTGTVMLRKPQEERGYTNMVKITTVSKQIQEILLPDSSVVVLNGNSSIRYHEAFDASATRDIYLEGNGFFKVKKNSGKPFMVHTPQLSVRVTGTEFNVNTRAATTNIVLAHGSVDVSFAEDAGRTIGSLLPGQSLNYDARNGELQKEDIQPGLYTAAWDDHEWHFDNTPLTTVVKLIEQFYGTEVVLNNHKLNNMKISAVVSVEDYSTLIRVIEKTLDVSVSETNEKVFIN